MILTTNRLQLRPCSETDLPFLHGLWTHDRVRYYLFDDRIITVAEARSSIQTSLDSFAQNHYGLWCIQHQNDWIGFTGLRAAAVPNLIYGIHPNFWGQGYATEAARAVFDYGLQTLKLPQINADVDEPNQASVRVLQKLGMELISRTVEHNRLLLYFAQRQQFPSTNDCGTAPD